MLIVAVGVLAFMVYRLTHHPGVVPSAILKRVDFNITLPTDVSAWKVEQASWHYDSSQKVLFFNVVSGSDKMIFSEQSLPDQFTDIQGYQDTFLSKLNRYGQLTAPTGTAYLTHPTELNGGQSVVLIGSGTLNFIQPSHNLGTDDWRRFLNDLQVVR